MTLGQKISEPVSVSLAYDSQKKKVCPKWVVWNNRLYPIAKVGLHHTFRQGRTLYHVFSVASRALFFRLVLDTETLHWKLEEIGDGLTP
ncbi:hypothetical protein A2125_01340 [Candidatus Woesebacteria bacterium GWB1_43_5]|uniref:Uncharacterized protein n=1 Tax=Candidatus Woesebacteria bacterium GWB1_43_5 TaxID=1802474 RepID=A0A1F7WRN5_9BACT|nr:MAG: hypothetical protein A2125_01340 [Candidatus Woesebacteria bacterium GWB1_43_5]